MTKDTKGIIASIAAVGAVLLVGLGPQSPICAARLATCGSGWPALKPVLMALKPVLPASKAQCWRMPPTPRAAHPNLRPPSRRHLPPRQLRMHVPVPGAASEE